MLPQIYFVRLLAIQCLGDDFSIYFENHRGISGDEPILHALLQFRNCHFVPVSFVSDELTIQLRKFSAIVGCGMAKVHLSFLDGKFSERSAHRSWSCQRPFTFR